MLIGAWLRFENLDGVEMTAGEAVSWVAAAAPNIREVFRVAIRLNPGKLGLHDVMMHVWMGALGDNLTALRALSAALGVLSILLVFVVVEELLSARSADSCEHDNAARQWIAATAALLVAINVPLIHHSREARMYMVLVPATLIQVWFFLRAHREGEWYNYAGLTAFSAVAVAAHFTAGAVMLAELLWLSPELLSWRWSLSNNPQARRALSVVAALAATPIILGPILSLPLHFAFGFFKAGAFGWVRSPGALAPIELFVAGFGGKSSGPIGDIRYRVSFNFVLMTALTIWGAIRGWRHAKSAVTFSLLWIWVPPLLLQLLSRVVAPFFLLEYALSSFVPFSILAALGMRELGQWQAFGALALSAVLGLAPIENYLTYRGDTQWREATTLAVASLRPGEVALVDPDWTIDVVHYYLREDTRTLVESTPKNLCELKAPFPTVLIITDYGAEHDLVGIKLLSQAPDLLGKFSGVSVFRISPERLAELCRG